MNVEASLEAGLPLRLVRTGWMSLSRNRTVTAADEVAVQLVAGIDDSSLVGAKLPELVVPEGPEDIARAKLKPPTTYVGSVPRQPGRLLVHIAAPPGEETGKLFATLISINEYLAESQALARVQLRKTIDSIIAGFAHEVRNPLSAILSLTEAAIQQEPSYESVLVRIPGLVGRVESLIKHSLAYSRPKPPSRALHQAAFLVDRAASLLRPRDTNVRLELPLDSDDDLPVLVDVLHAEQILVNLIENALDAAQTVVTLTVREAPTKVPAVCLTVYDDGPGVPHDLQSRIFEPFFTTKAKGTGLGLAIARDLARLNGGDLKLEPTPSGASFALILPSGSTAVRAGW